MNWRHWRKRIRGSWRSALAGAALCVLLGTFLLISRVGELSYDLLFLPGLHREAAPEELVIIDMDDRSFEELSQTSIKHWDRNLHANIVDKLTEDGARLVIFDILFIEPGLPSANTNFARAMRKNGKVVLAGSMDAKMRLEFEGKVSVLPLQEFLDAAAAWGIAETRSPKGATVRQYILGSEHQPSMPWAAARLAGAGVGKAPGSAPPDTWLNFYGPAGTLNRFSYCDVTNQPPGFFRGKYVFIGHRPKTLKAFEEADAFPTPYTRWPDGELFPGVEIGATAFLNFLRDDGLVALDGRKQFVLILCGGVVMGGLLGLLRPVPAIAVALLAILLCFVGAIELAKKKAWFSWTIIAFAQVPCALGWSLRNQFFRLHREKEKLEWTLAEATKREEASKSMPPPKAAPAGLAIPDHTMVRRVGKGAYGEVWLARNAIGAYHAVKIVQRRNFPADEPYEREFRGIQKFMPISRSHPGLVHVLHVGRNDEVGFFFCIMEAGDDVASGQQINPDIYRPKTLSSEMEQRGRLSPEESLELGLALSNALDHLHRQKLIHRDIKPGNIIYVHSAPKFADIGLVTDIRSEGRDVSYLGTEGYIAPEGPGTASADVYALGKVLYEACMGRDRCLFPEVPTAILEQPSDTLVRRLNEVIFKACENAANERYQSAAELHTDLLKLIHLLRKKSS